MSVYRLQIGFSVLFIAAHLATSHWPASWTPPQYWNGALHESEHLFVDVRAEQAQVHARSERDAEVLREIGRGTLLLLADVEQAGDVTWNRVLIGPNEYGWIARVLPAELGVPETRVSMADKFRFHWHYLYALALDLLWGLLNFRLRPV